MVVRLDAAQLARDARGKYRSLERNYMRQNQTRMGLVAALAAAFSERHPDKAMSNIDASQILRKFVTGKVAAPSYTPNTKIAAFLEWLAYEINPDTVLVRHVRESSVPARVGAPVEPEPEQHEDLDLRSALAVALDVDVDALILTPFVQAWAVSVEVFNPDYVLKALGRVGITERSVADMIRLVQGKS